MARTWQGALLWTSIFLGLVGFTQEPSPFKRWGLGGLHGVGHILLSVICVRAAAEVAAPIGGNLAWAAYFALLLVVGGLAGSLLMALYLVLADHFGCNANELFAAQRIVDYKCFVRLHLDKEGTLTLYPIAVDKGGAQVAVPARGRHQRPMVRRRPAGHPTALD